MPTLAHRRMRGIGAAGKRSGPAVWLVDTFPATKSAPLGSPFSAGEVGQWMLYDTGNRMSIAAGGLTCTTQGASTKDPQAGAPIRFAPYGREAFAVDVTMSATTHNPELGYVKDFPNYGTLMAGAWAVTPKSWYVGESLTGYMLPALLVPYTTSKIRIGFIRAPWGGLVVNSPSGTVWNVMSPVCRGRMEPNQYTYLRNSVTSRVTYDNARAIRLGSPETAVGTGYYNQGGWAVTRTEEHPADFLASIYYRFAAAGQTASDVAFRVVDDENKWVIRVVSGDVGTGSLKLIEVTAGEETERINITAKVYYTSSQYEVSLAVIGDVITIVQADTNHHYSAHATTVPQSYTSSQHAAGTRMEFPPSPWLRGYAISPPTITIPEGL